MTSYPESLTVKKLIKMRFFTIKIHHISSYRMTQILQIPKIIFGVSKYRQAVLKLRISAHRVPVETGRFGNVPYNKIICQQCGNT